MSGYAKVCEIAEVAHAVLADPRQPAPTARVPAHPLLVPQLHPKRAGCEELGALGAKDPGPAVRCQEGTRGDGGLDQPRAARCVRCRHLAMHRADCVRSMGCRRSQSQSSNEARGHQTAVLTALPC